jgi:uncharacterized protein with PQ loop repeat
MRTGAQPHPPSDDSLKWLMAALSAFTLAMTIPQVWTIWVSRQSAGVSLWSWSAYWISAVVWFAYGLKRRDPNIYMPCIGWLLLDGAVVIGAVMVG